MREALVNLDMGVAFGGEAEAGVGLDVCEAGVGWCEKEREVERLARLGE